MSRKMKMLFIGIEAELRLQVLQGLAATWSEIAGEDQFLSELERFDSGRAEVIVCGDGLKDIDPAECAQSLRQRARNNPILFVSAREPSFDRKTLKKNGFSEVFLLPAEREA